MKEFDEHLKFYSVYWFMHFSKDVPEQIWGDVTVARTYLEKYWLDLSEYKSLWQPILEDIFINIDDGLPKPIFNKEYNILAFKGGCLFLENDFKKLQECMLALGDKYFVIVENTFGGKLTEPAFRMKFPAEISWGELNSGNYISAIILETNHKEFFVFSASHLWGKYVASDFESPLDIIGFKPENGNLFKEKFSQTDEEWKEVIRSLPQQYISLVEKA